LLVACCLGLLRLICVCAMRETSNRFALYSRERFCCNIISRE
jgi:hypothetical protein